MDTFVANAALGMKDRLWTMGRGNSENGRLSIVKLFKPFKFGGSLWCLRTVARTRRLTSTQTYRKTLATLISTPCLKLLHVFAQVDPFGLSACAEISDALLFGGLMQ